MFWNILFISLFHQSLYFHTSFSPFLPFPRFLPEFLTRYHPIGPSIRENLDIFQLFPHIPIPLKLSIVAYDWYNEQIFWKSLIDTYNILYL